MFSFQPSTGRDDHGTCIATTIEKHAWCYIAAKVVLYWIEYIRPMNLSWLFLVIAHMLCLHPNEGVILDLIPSSDPLNMKVLLKEIECNGQVQIPISKFLSFELITILG